MSMSKRKKKGLCGTNSFHMRHPYITWLIIDLSVAAVCSIATRAILRSKGYTTQEALDALNQ